MERRISVITKFIKLAQEDGKFRADLDAEAVAHIFLGSLRFLVTTWRLSGFKGDIRVKGKTMKSTLLQLIN